MSAIGTKRTFRVVPHMSANGGKADMPFCTANVRLWPKADMGSDLTSFGMLL
jgi:hypothetical protein